MIDWKQDLALLSDLSANIFAVFILVLMILLQQGQQSGPEDLPQPPEVIEATTELATVERVPLPAASMITHLYDRRTSADGLSIDLFDNRIVVGLAGEELQFPTMPARGELPPAQALQRLLQSRSANGGPARLYVFSNRYYAAVVEVLNQSGWSFREVSVPLALRERSGPSRGDAWSGAFLELIARPLDPPRFRLALARLLAGSGEGTGPTLAAEGKGSPSPVQQSPSLTDRLLQLAANLGTILGFVMIMTAVGAVLLIEFRWPRRQRDRRSALHRSTP